MSDEQVVEDRGDTLADGAPAGAEEILVDPIKGDVEKIDETDPEAVEKAEKDDKKKDSRIPLARHKELLEKGRVEREALAAENARLRAGQQSAATNEAIEATEAKLTGLEAKYNKLLADGDIDKATATMTEIRRLERTIGDQKSDMRAQLAESRAVERVRYDTVVERIEAAFPQMNPDHEDFDRESVVEVLELKSAFEAKGATPAAALQKAVKYVLGAETSKQTTATEVTPKVDKAEVKTDLAAAAALARKQEALKRNIAAAKATPAATDKIGLNSDEKGGTLTSETAMKLSQAEFSKITEKDLARLRGDEL